MREHVPFETNYICYNDMKADLRFDKHNNPKKNSEPAEHIKQNEGHAHGSLSIKLPEHKTFFNLKILH